MKATSGPLPTGGAWAYEVKWDGMRLLLHLDRGGLRLTTTNGIDATDRFPELAALGAALAAHTAVLDGEVVALDEDGRPDFGRLQRRMHVSRRADAARLAGEVPIRLMLFDLLHLDGHDLTALPYRDRRHLLERLVEQGPHWQVPPVYDDGAALRDAVAAQEMEGVVAKRRDSPYEPGRRSRAWIKTKVRPQQELVVGGWLPGSGARSGRLGSLLVGYHDPPGGPLRYAGRVGSGLTDDEIARLAARFEELSAEVCPFDPPPPREVSRAGRWVDPVMVVEVQFAEWTGDGRLRHPTYRGERLDVDADRVVREPG